MHSPIFAHRVHGFFPLFDGWHMARFHIIVFKSGRVGNQICTIHLFSRRTDFGKISSYREGGTFNSSRVSLPEIAKAEFPAITEDLMGNPQEILFTIPFCQSYNCSSRVGSYVHYDRLMQGGPRRSRRSHQDRSKLLTGSVCEGIPI